MLLASLNVDPLPGIESQEPIVADVVADDVVSCIPEMTTTAGAAATVALPVAAPYHASAPFTIHHQDMLFTAMMGDEGTANLKVPALAEVAVMIAAFEDGDGAVATVVVPDFANYDRAVLQWQGNTSIMLSAYEGDAAFGDANHITLQNPGNMERLVAAEGGFLMLVGDRTVPDALMAEVHTFPSGMTGEARDVALVAEAEVTVENCGQELSAQSIQVSPTGAATALDLIMQMPDCDTVGNFLILQNMFEDLTLASR